MAAVRFLPRLLNAHGKFAGPEHLRSLLTLPGNPEYISFWDDFLGTGAGTWPASQHWSYPATIGTGTEVIAVVTAAIGGVLTMTTGGNSGDGAYQALGLHWRGTEGIYFIARAKLTAATTAKFEIGLSDSITGEGVVATKATPTFTGTDGAVFVYDTVDDTNVTFITANGGVVGANVDKGGLTLTDYHVFEVVVQGGFASGYIDGRYIGGGAISTTAPLTPLVGVTTRVAATRTLSVDYIGCIGPRAAVA